MNKICYIILLGLLPIQSMLAQDEHRGLIDGNSFFVNKDYDKAAAEYEKIIQVNKNSVKGQYNLGNARYEKQEYEKAVENYKAAIASASDDNTKAKAFHNLGNAFVKKEKYEDAVNAYKSSLRLNPADLDTKHNLAQTLRMIQKNQPPPPPQDNKENKEENNPPPPEEETPKDELDRMMDMMDNEDKKTQEKKQNPPSRKRKPEKDW
jgi:tetratricopeptide (TPR) repeat protein